MKKSKSKPACPLCASPLRSAANSMRQLNASTIEIAESCNIAAGDVERHFSQCVLSPELQANDAEPIAGSDQELHRLMRDAEETYHTAVLQGNQAAAVSALTSRLRVVVELGRRAQFQKKTEQECDPRNPDTWSAERAAWVTAYFDFLLEHFERQADQKTQVTQ